MSRTLNAESPRRIVGGGLAGAASAGTLSRLPDVEVKVYERADKVREAGALIGIMVSGKPGTSLNFEIQGRGGKHPRARKKNASLARQLRTVH